MVEVEEACRYDLLISGGEWTGEGKRALIREALKLWISSITLNNREYCTFTEEKC